MLDLPHRYSEPFIYPGGLGLCRATTPSTRRDLPHGRRAAKASPYLLSLETVRNELVRPRRESVKISHFDGSKLYQRGPLR